MNVFEQYKPLRNKIAQLPVTDSLSVIWAYCQYLQINNFKFPNDIEVWRDFLRDKLPQRFAAEWEFELLAKEVILNSGTVATKGRTLRQWKVVAEVINKIKDLENNIYGAFGSPENVLVEMIRIAHRQFIWQGNRPNAAAIIRYYKVFNRPGIDEICLRCIGLNVWQIFMCGVAVMGHFLDRPVLTLPVTSQIKALPQDMFEKFFSFTSRSLANLRHQLKSEQQYNANFAYAYSSLRAYPLVRIEEQERSALVCPLITLLFWRFTGGLYYELVNVPEFANEFGNGFQNYVGEVIERTCPDPMQRICEREYHVGKAKKRSVDWIVADERATLFLECKSRRLSWGAKVSLNDLGPLESDIENMATAVIQVYKTLTDYQSNAYPHYPFEEGRRIFPAIVTLENWHMFGPVMMNKLAQAVASKINDAGLSSKVVEEMPYSIFAIEELESAFQIMHAKGIADFISGKLTSREMRDWDWRGYMSERYPKSSSARGLFQDDYHAMFADLLRAEGLST
jgi:hypothetical protein